MPPDSDAGKYKSETRAAPMPQGSFPEQQKQHPDLSIEVLFFYTLKTE